MAPDLPSKSMIIAFPEKSNPALSLTSLKYYLVALSLGFLIGELKVIPTLQRSEF